MGFGVQVNGHIANARYPRLELTSPARAPSPAFTLYITRHRLSRSPLLSRPQWTPQEPTTSKHGGKKKWLSREHPTRQLSIRPWVDYRLPFTAGVRRRCRDSDPREDEPYPQEPEVTEAYENRPRANHEKGPRSEDYDTPPAEDGVHRCLSGCCEAHAEEPDVTDSQEEAQRADNEGDPRCQKSDKPPIGDRAWHAIIGTIPNCLVHIAGLSNRRVSPLGHSITEG